MPDATLPTPNPLVRCRADTGLSQEALAARMQVSTNVVKWAEAGCYHVIPPAYKERFPKLLHENSEYQQFRHQKRLRNFPLQRVVFNEETCAFLPVGFKKVPPKSMKELLSDLSLTAYGFAVSACVQHAEVYKLLENKKVTLPSNLVDFFQTIQLPDEWILQFNRNINAEFNEADKAAVRTLRYHEERTGKS